MATDQEIIRRIKNIIAREDLTVQEFCVKYKISYSTEHVRNVINGNRKALPVFCDYIDMKLPPQIVA